MRNSIRTPMRTWAVALLASLTSLASFAAIATGCGSRTDPVCAACDVPGSGAFSDAGALPGVDVSLPPTDDGAIGFDLGLPPRDSRFEETPPFPDATRDLGASPDSGPPPIACPPTLPADGVACGATLDCTYRGCDPTRDDHARCDGARWSVVASACLSECPIAVPPDGTPCTLPYYVGCEWSARCIGSDLGFCRDGAWSVKRARCEAADPGCPAAAPTDGATCPHTPAGTGVACLYPNECGQVSEFLCADDRWTRDRSGACSAPAPCPSSAPKAGDPCSTVIGCGYPNDCGSVDSYTCGGSPDFWFKFPGRCAAPACPTTPKPGDACPTDGVSCVYPLGGGCSFDCACRGGTWKCDQPPCAG